MEEDPSLKVEGEDEHESREPSSSPQIADEVEFQRVESKLIQCREDSDRHGKPNATTLNLPARHFRAPVLKKRLFELQIPSAVRELIVKLGSHNAPQSLKLKDLQSLSFGTLFGGKHGFQGADQKWANLSADRIATLRMMLLMAVGYCSTLRALNLGNSPKLHRFHLTLRELEELLNRLQSSPVILELNLDGHEILETEDGGKILGRFLVNNHTLETLHIFNSDLNSHVLKSLASNAHPTLRNLRLYLNPTEDGVFDTVSAILQACPKLREMPDFEWRCDDEEDAGRWAEVLVRHSSLDAVEIAGPVGSLDAFLRSVLDSTCQLCLKKSLRKLTMMTLNDQLLQPMPQQIVPFTVSANRNLETLAFVGIRLTSDEWQEIFTTLKQDGVLRKLQLEDMQQGFDSGAWKELGALVDASSNLEVLKLHDPCSDVQPSVEYIFRAMKMNRSLKKVKFLMSGHKIDNHGVCALAEALEVNDVLEHLDLDGCVLSNMETVFRSLRRNSKLRELGLYSCKGLNDAAYTELLGTLRINSTLREINLRRTHWATDHQEEELCRAPGDEATERSLRDSDERILGNNFDQLKAG